MCAADFALFFRGRQVHEHSPEERDEVRNSLGVRVGRRARKSPRQQVSFCALLITTVNEHWALLPASARGLYPVRPRGTGITVPTYQLMSQICKLFVNDSFLVLKLAGKTQVPENG